jgi:hypothetical protein
MKDRMTEAKRAFQTCRDAGDKLTPHKLLLADVALDARLNKQLSGLRTTESEDDRRTARMIELVGNDLDALHAEAVEYLGLKPAKKEEK